MASCIVLVRGCVGMEESEKVKGCYRDIEDLLVKLADFYLNYNQFQVTLDETNTFYAALGGDGAPFGKDDTACSRLVSFLNIGHGILSSNENFLLFGANCSENCLPVKRFLSQLMLDISKVQSTSYSIACKGKAIDVRLVFAELPNDMKMLSFLAGELSNSTTFFLHLQMLMANQFQPVVQQHLVISLRILGNPGSILTGLKWQKLWRNTKRQ